MTNIYPSVTQVLSVFLPDRSKLIMSKMREKARIGTKVHQICASLCTDSFELNDPECEAYIESFKKWKAIFPPYEVLLSETEVVDENWQFRGTPDLVIKTKDQASIYLIDFKTCATPMPIWRGQLAAYAYLLRKIKRIYPDRLIYLSLKKDGRQAIAKEESDTSRSLQAFFNSLIAYKYFTLEKGAYNDRLF